MSMEIMTNQQGWVNFVISYLRSADSYSGLLLHNFSYVTFEIWNHRFEIEQILINQLNFNYDISPVNK